MPTAILIDGDFFLKRYRIIFGKQSPEKVAQDLHHMCLDHLMQDGIRKELYRIFYYDCPPLMKKAHYPVSRKAINFGQTPTAKWRLSFHNELRKKRKVALRLGYLNSRAGHWSINPEKLKMLMKGEIGVEQLTDRDFHYEIQQKGVDIRIGLDIASMAYKKQVDQIILVSGDSDFVPAAKLARREGIDFVLDPLWSSIREDLKEHIDGLHTVWPKPHTE